MPTADQAPRVSRRHLLAATGAVAGMGALHTFAGSVPATAANGTPNWRPVTRFAPRRNWMNDPNGLVHLDGEYHFFFQHNPYGDKWGNMSWGHAVSRDLVRWEELDVALEPDELGQIFSGSAVVDKDDTSGLFDGGSGLVAVYTSAGEKQQQSLAWSTDRGRTWTKHPDNPVIPNPGVPDFRDPKVIWHAASKRWILLLAAGDRIQVYGSTNLLEWNKLSEFGADHVMHDGVWECPDLFELPVDGGASRWVLVVSINPGGPASGSATMYFVGDFDGKTFTSDNPTDTVLWADRGSDFYAPQSFSDMPGDRRVWVGWLSNWNYAEVVPTDPWRGMATSPRELSLTAAGGRVELAQRPVDELLTARTNPRAWSGAVTSDRGPKFSGASVDIEATFELGSAESVAIDLFVGNGHRTRVGYDVAAEELFIDRTKSGSATVRDGFAAVHPTPLKLSGDTLSLRVVADRSSVEVFADGGRAVLTDLVLPDEGDEGIRLLATKGSARVEVDIFDLRA